MNEWMKKIKHHHAKPENKLVLMMEQNKLLNDSLEWLEEQYDRLLESVRPFSKMGHHIKEEIEMLWVGKKMHQFLYEKSIGKLQDNLSWYLKKCRNQGKTPNPRYVQMQNESIRNIIDYVQRLETLNSLMRMEIRRNRMQIEGIPIDNNIHSFKKNETEDDVLDLIIEEFPSQANFIKKTNAQIERAKDLQKTKTNLVAKELLKTNPYEV